MLAHELRLEQHEAVGLEQLAEIDIGERPRVRRIAGPLERVQLARREWVVRRNLVGDEHGPARSGHPGQLGDHQLRPRHVMQRPQRSRQVEGRAREIELLDVALDEGDIRRRLGPAALDQLRNELDRDDLPYERRQCEGQGAGARAGIERSLLAGQRDEVADARGELVRAALLQRGEPISRRCEPSPRCVVRTQGPPLSS